MQRMFPTRSSERITSCDNLNRYFAALSPSSAAGQAFLGLMIADCESSNGCGGVGIGNSNKPSVSRYFCFPPQKRVWPLFHSAQQKNPPSASWCEDTSLLSLTN